MFKIGLPAVLIASSLSLYAKSDSKLCTKQCTMKGIDFTSSEFKDTNFENRDLESVVFNEVNLSKREFQKTRLNNVRFLNSNMTLTEFKDASIKSTVFENILADNYLTIKSSKLSEVTFRMLKAKNIDFSESTFSSCVFDGISSDSTKYISLSGSKLIDSDFKNEKFNGRVDLSDSLISKSDFTNARFLSSVITLDMKIENSRFDNAYFAQSLSLNVRESSFTGITMEGEDGGHLICHSSNFSGATIKNRKFRISSAENCDFSNADLSSIEKVNFNAVKNSNFCNAKMPDGTVGKCEK